MYLEDAGHKTGAVVPMPQGGNSSLTHLALRRTGIARRGATAIAAAALRAAAYQPRTVESAVPMDRRTTTRLPIYTGHMLPPSDRDGAFEYRRLKPATTEFGGREELRKHEAAFWLQQEYPTHSTKPSRSLGGSMWPV